MGAKTTGRRIPTPQFANEGTDEWPWPWKPGDYWKNDAGEWEARTPNGLHVGLARHEVTEHVDGTITVSPSILSNAPGLGNWHGFLRLGVWEECD